MVTESEVEVYKAENGDVIWNVHKSVGISPDLLEVNDDT